MGSPYEISRMENEQLRQVPDYQLLGALSNTAVRNEKMFDEARRRELLTESEIRLVKKRSLKKGMSEYALIAARGQPIRVESLPGAPDKKKYVYGFDTKYTSETFVFIDKGKVSGWWEKKN
ncbi:MAG: hypothetical protein R6V41_08475 [Desulfobacteraceae bacterium]